MILNRWTPKATLIVGGVVVVGGYFVLSKATKTAGQAVTALNPANQNNVINQAFNSLYDGGLDGEGTLGTDIADVNRDYSPYALADRVRGWLGLDT